MTFFNFLFVGAALAGTDSAFTQELEQEEVLQSLQSSVQS